MGNAKLAPEKIDRVASLHKSGLSMAAVAREAGVSKFAVLKYSRQLGLKPNPRIAFTEGQRADLAVLSDRAMHRKYGIHASVWAKLRKEMGLPHFRPPTVVRGVPQGRSEPKRKFIVPTSGPDALQPTITQVAPKRDHSLAGEAASHLRRERFSNVFDRAKVYGKEGWQVGRMVLSAAEMVAMAKRHGFVERAWMGGL